MLDISFSKNKLSEINQKLEKMTAQQRFSWAFENMSGDFALSSSFGVQSAVSLHMATKIIPDIPIILIDTGYLFPE